MAKRLRNAAFKNLSPLLFFAGLLLLWQGIRVSGLAPAFMLPGPWQVTKAFVNDFSLITYHMGVTLWEAMCGLALAVASALVLAIVMDISRLLRRSLTPVLLLTQTVPTIALAPLLVLWFGSGAAPKIVLVFLTCFFPMTIALLGALAQIDEDAIRLLGSMGASRRQLYLYC